MGSPVHARTCWGQALGTVEIDGEQRPLLECDLDAKAMDANADDPELREYVVGIDWIDVRPLSEAYWETGMYANQNTATKLRNQFTLDRLHREFNMDS